MIKKILVALAALCMLVFAGCSKDSDSDTNITGKNSAASSSESDESGKESLDAFIDAYIEKVRNGASLNEICRDVYPNAFIEQMQEEGSWDSFVSTYDAALKNLKMDSENLKQTCQLSSSQLKGAEKLYSSSFNCNVKITEGYEYQFITVAEYGGSKQREPSTMCAVYLEDEGWKVIRTTAVALDD